LLFRAALGRLQVQCFSSESASAAVMPQVLGQDYLPASLDLSCLSGWVALLLTPLFWLVRMPHSGAVAASAE
jgi:hypothetical protein